MLNFSKIINFGFFSDFRMVMVSQIKHFQAEVSHSDYRGALKRANFFKLKLILSERLDMQHVLHARHVL